MKELLLSMKAAVEQAKALGQHEVDVLLLAHFLRRYDSILAEGYQANPLLEHPASLNMPSEHRGEPNKALLGICWIDSLGGSGPCCASCSILRFLVTTTRRSEICG
jgi:hypothetical protein